MVGDRIIKVVWTRIRSDGAQSQGYSVPRGWVNLKIKESKEIRITRLVLSSSSLHG